MRKNLLSNNYPGKMANLPIFNKIVHFWEKTVHLENINLEKFRNVTVNLEFHRFSMK